jgi:putative FmdB family regulatory protein
MRARRARVTLDATEGNTMPDYEFFCRKCKQPFTQHMHIKEHDEHAAECPKCHRTQGVEKRISFVNVMTAKKS